MSIPFSVAATLMRGEIEEDNYAVLDDPEILRLVGIATLEIDPVFTTAFPARQGAEVIVRLRNRRTVRHLLRDVIPATPAQIGARFRLASSRVIGEERALHLERLVMSCEQLPDAGVIAAQCRLVPPDRPMHPT
jgi:2-methylcitrate dehydratase PrpD